MYRRLAGTPIGKVRIGSSSVTAHPLVHVTLLYKQLKQRYPLIQLAVRKVRRSRRGLRMAASILAPVPHELDAEKR
jgi:hypothetical protein